MKRVALDEVGSIARGRSRHRPRDDSVLYGGNYPFVQTGDVKRAQLYLNKYSQTYNEVGLAQSKLWPVGTLCITIAANIADTAILGIPACFPDSVIGFTPDPAKSDLRFIKYCLDCFKLQVQAISHGTTQDNLSLRKLQSLRFLMPSLPEQQKIAAILTAYDDLIENNRQRIALLEKMAEEIYREWFVRLRFPEHEHTPVHKGVPEGWSLSNLNSVCVEQRHAVPKRKFDEPIRYVGLEHIPRRAMTLDGFELTDAIGSNKFRFEKDDILFGKIRPYLHKVARAGFSGVCSTDAIVLRPNSPDHAEFVLLTVFSNSFIDLASTASKGTKMPRADWDYLSNASMVIPSEKLLAKFSKLTKPIFALTQKLTTENESLQTTRDLLLNRLISGKLRVDDLDIQFPPSMQA